MKKYPVILVLMLILFQSGGYFFIFQAGHLGNRERMFSDAAQNGRLIQIELTAERASLSSRGDAIEWLEADEFRMGGAYYDVLKTENADGKIILHCLKDSGDGFFFGQIEAHADQQYGQSGGEGNIIKSPKKTIEPPYVIPQYTMPVAATEFLTFVAQTESALPLWDCSPAEQPPRKSC